jgi:hypothetical protein
MEEIVTLSEFGKYARDEEFKLKVSNFLWSILCKSEQYKEDLISNIIIKFGDMVKNWDLSKK